MPNFIQLTSNLGGDTLAEALATIKGFEAIFPALKKKVRNLFTHRPAPKLITAIFRDPLSLKPNKAGFNEGRIRRRIR
jgi:hypothetical protein